MLIRSETKRFNTLIDSFPYAMSVASIISSTLDILKLSNRLKIIEIDAFPAIFTKNIFFAFRDLKLANQIDYIVHENDRKDLDLIRSKINLEGLDIKYQITQVPYLNLINPNEKVVVLINNFLANHDQETLLETIEILNENTSVELVIGVEKLSRKFDISLAQIDLPFCFFEDNNLYHYLIAKDKSVLAQLKPSLEHEFVANNNTEKYLDLIKVLNKACCPQAASAIKLFIEEMSKLDGYSSNNYFFLGRFYKIFGYKQKALENYQKARLIDSYGLIDIDSAVEQLQKQ